MDDSEYYSMMRRQYSNIVELSPKKSGKSRSGSSKSSDSVDGGKTLPETSHLRTEGTFSEWNRKYGHEDAEMFLERNTEDDEE